MKERRTRWAVVTDIDIFYYTLLCTWYSGSIFSFNLCIYVVLVITILQMRELSHRRVKSLWWSCNHKWKNQVSNPSVLGPEAGDRSIRQTYQAPAGLWALFQALRLQHKVPLLMELTFKWRKVTVSKQRHKKLADGDKNNRRYKSGRLLQNKDSGKANLRRVVFWLGWKSQERKGHVEIGAS